MKKILLIALLALTACQKEETTTINGTTGIEQSISSKLANGEATITEETVVVKRSNSSKSVDNDVVNFTSDLELELVELDCYDENFGIRRIELITNLDLNDYEMLVYERRVKKGRLTRIFVALPSYDFTETDYNWNGTKTFEDNILTIYDDNRTENIYDIMFSFVALSDGGSGVAVQTRIKDCE